MTTISRHATPITLRSSSGRRTALSCLAALLTLAGAASQAACTAPLEDGTTGGGAPLVAVSDASWTLDGIDVPTASLPDALQEMARAHVADAVEDGRAAAWVHAVVGPHARPLYRPGTIGAAYYELPVFAGATLAGTMVLSTGDHDFPMVYWNATGTSPTAEIAVRARALGKVISRFLKIDMVTFAGETNDGELLAPSEHAPQPVIDPSAGDLPAGHRAEIAAAWSRVHAPSTELGLAPQARVVRGDRGTGEYCEIAETPDYGQPSNGSYVAGCGPTAWAILFGWGSRGAANGTATPTLAGVYRSYSTTTAPLVNDATVEKMIWDLRGSFITLVSQGQTATGPTEMVKASNFVTARRAYAVSVESDYDALLNSQDRLRDKVS